MGELKGSQRKYLRGVAHSYKPMVWLLHNPSTNQGLAFARDQREQFVPVIEERVNCECVGTVGRMAILYREHPDPEKRKIAVPK